MVQNETYFESHDGTKLFLYRWQTETQLAQPRAVLHIVHGMAEHAVRYNRLAEKFTQEGIEVWAADQRGHGKTADLTVNAKNRGGLAGYCGDSGFARVAGDVHAINKEIRKTVKNVPLFLLGHSWGSFIVQNYIEEYGKELDINGCMLSGTRGPGGGFKIKAGIPFLTMLAFFRGQSKGSKLAKSMADGPYNDPFKPNRTPFDWISRDETEVDKYTGDPNCGFLCSSGFYRDLAKLLNRIHSPSAMAKINRDLPVYVFSGSADPVGDMSASPTALVNAYRNMGFSDLEFVLYPGARHETLNETNREEVMDNLLSWINKRINEN